MSFQQAAEQRRQEVGRLQQMRASRTTVQGWKKIVGSGEVTVTINFPVTFFEKPVFTFGGELAENHSPEAGAYPVISAVVVGWEVQERSQKRNHFIGARIAVVALGKADQEIYLHFHFEGKAFRNPDNPEPDVDEVL